MQAPPVLHNPNAHIVVRTILLPKPGVFAKDVKIILTDIPRVHVYTVNATFGDLEAPSGARLVIDTGSSATWILGEHVVEGIIEGVEIVPKEHGEEAQIGHHLYRPDAGAKLEGTGSFRADYRDGSVAVGDVYNDNLYLLSRDNRRMTPATPVTFGVTTLANWKALSLEEADGILGLGYVSPKNFGDPAPQSFLQALNKKYKLDGPFYSLKLRDRAGTLTFGRPSSTAEFVWEHVNTSREQWEVFHSMLNVRVGKDGVWKTHTFGDQNMAMIDSGCNMCYAKAETVETIYKSLGGINISGSWCIPKNAPECHIKIKLGTTWIRLPGRFLHFLSHDKDFDLGALQVRTGKVDTYGAAFLRYVNAHFDAHPAEPRIGFVEAW